jgi:adenine-specific DNA-methyltransferase
MLGERGQLAFITQNNLFTSLAGEPIRQFLQQQGCLRRILDFGHAKVFDNAGAYTCLVFLGRESRNQFEYEFLEQPPTRESLGRVTYSQIPVTKLNAKKWRLAKPYHLDNLERIEHAGTPLGEVAEIRVGFATLKDSVFLVRDAGSECLAIGPSGEDVVVEREITRQAIKVADVTGENELQHNRLRIIFPYRKTDRGYAIIPADQLNREFPRAIAHLESCRHLLDARDKGKRNAEAWHAWGRTQGREASGPKLLTKTFDRRPNFMLDQSDQLFCNGYSVALRDDAPSWLTIEILQHFLNSPVMQYYAKLTSFQIAGGFQCYQKNFIERFGIPLLADDDVRELSTLETDLRGQFIVTNVYGFELDEICEITSRE